jgi:hypothetical protein
VDLPSTDQPFAQEYRELLSRQTTRELRGIAQRRNIQVEGTRKAPIVETLAAQLSDRPSTCAEVLRLDDLGRKLLAYLHLTLPQGYGIPLESIKSLGQPSHSQASSYSPSAIRTRAIEMSKRGLLLTFKQGQVTYYLLPQLVRLCIPPQPGLAPAYSGVPARDEHAGQEETMALEVDEQPFALLSQKLYIVWNYVAQRHPRRRAAPGQAAIEDEWPQLQGWDHLQSEIDELARKEKTQRSRFFADVFAYTGTQAMTVPASGYHLSGQDRSELRTLLGQSAQAQMPWDEEIEFYYALLAEMGAIAGEPGEPLQADPRILQRLWSLSPSEQASALAQAWKATTTWSEMDIVLRTSDDLRVRRNVTYTTYRPQDLYEEWRAGRLTVFRFLSLLESNRWLSLDGLLRTIYETTPNLIHTRSHSKVWWLESAQRRRQFGTNLDDWRQSAGLFVRAVIEGPLAWLGIVKLGYRRGNNQGDQENAARLEAIQLTPTGSFFIGRREMLAAGVAPPPPQEAVELGDDLTITLVPGHAPPRLYDLLYAIGQLTASSPQQFAYRITASGVKRAFDSGETAETLIASLEEACGEHVRQAGLPATWKARLNEWYQNYGKLHLYQGITLLELADEYALQELVFSTSLREKIVYQFSPHLIAIQPDAVDDLVQEMEKRGYTPCVK